MVYTKEFLVSELHRFVNENKRIPTIRYINIVEGYPSASTYQDHFGSWNKALEAARLKINNTHEKRTKNKKCCICGCNSKQKLQWHTKGLPKDKVMCNNCYHDVDYKNSNLDKNSATGKGFISQRIVANVLNLSLENDCNCSIGFNAPYDLYDKEKYGKIDVKSSKLNKNSFWVFTFNIKKTPDTYILVGFDEDRKNILRVWICKPTDDLVYDKNSVLIKNIYKLLLQIKRFEVDCKPYDNALHSMSLDNCSVLRRN